MTRTNTMHPIPQPPAMPVLGNMLSLGTTAPLQEMMKLAEELGPIFWLNMMGTPLVIVSGASLVEELCDEARFDKSTRGTLRRMRVVGGDALFTADTKMPNWSKAHNILLPNFGLRAMQGYHDYMLDIASQMMLKWQRLNPDDDIDVVRDMTALTLDTIGLCGFDYRFNSFYREGNHPFIDALVRTLETTMETRGLPLEDIVMKKKKRQLKIDVDYMNNMVDDIIRRRRASGEGIAEKPDLLSYMLAGVDKKTGEKLDDVNIRYQCNTFLIAGHETTSGMLSFTMHFLLQHPEVLAKCYEEADRVLGGDINVLPTYQQVTQLTYITQVLKEALRLWPTAGMFMLQPYQDTVIGGQYKIKRNHMVGVLAPALHRDPEAWGPDAKTFNPDNFSREAEANRSPHAYKPFGNGQRACIGRQFALQESALVLGMILQRFELIDHLNYRLEVKETLTMKPEGLRIKVRMRPGRQPGIGGPAIAPGAAQPAAAQAGRALGAGAKPIAEGIPRHDTPLLVLFGSNLGSAEDFARQIADTAAVSGFKVTLGELDEYAEKLPTEGLVTIVSASYNGGAPDNAVAFMKWLDGLDAGAAPLKGVTYNVFGCGNRDWASTYQVIPRSIDEKMEALGARRIHPRGEGDAREDLDGDFQSWFDGVKQHVMRALKLDETAMRDADEAGDAYTVEFLPPPAAAPLMKSHGAATMIVQANRELQRQEGPKASDRSTRHIEIQLPAGTTYRAGDHLGVLPLNGETLVSRVLERFGLARDAYVRLAANSERKTFLPVDDVLPVRRLLASFVELQAVATRKQITTLAKHTRCPFSQPKLAALAGEGEGGVEFYRAQVSVPRKSVLDLLEEFQACELPFNVFLEMMPLMTPRYYSISSSPAVSPDRVSITVGIVEGAHRSGNGIYQGTSSNHLRRQGHDGSVHAFLKETTAGFRLPDDPATPVIMIGPGTGLAPFRSFLQERAHQKAEGKDVGPALLFFGCRHPEQDFLYEEELRGFAEQGVVDLQVAFSRVEEGRTYVQDLVRQQGEKVWSLIQRGAKVYVCGDGSRMEPDVRRALADLYATLHGGDTHAADAWMDSMMEQQRYVLDVWSGN